MIRIRKSHNRGVGSHGWLYSLHTFSFADYFDPAHVHFGPLRVINEDEIMGGGGFGAHPHRDMEIITYVTRGALQHEDSMGNKSTILPGEVQHMSAGSGVVHSEFNASKTEPVHLLQIWIIPSTRGIKPCYGQKSFAEEISKGNLVHVISQDGRNGSLPIQQNANVYISKLKDEKANSLTVGKNRLLWVQVVAGAVDILGETLQKGDGAAISDESDVTFQAKDACEIIIFDLPEAE